MANAFTSKIKAVWAFIKRVAVRVFNYLKVAKLEWIVMISVFAVDLIVKALIEALLDYGQTVTLIPYVFNMHRIHNYAAAFGSSWIRGWMGDIGARIFFCVFAVAASVAFILVLIRNKGKSRVFRIAIALFVAGAMGNCIDRMALGYVRDFIEFVYLGMTIGGRTTWPYIFNIADVALVTGVILIVFYFLFLYKDSDKKSHDEYGGDVVSVESGAAVAEADAEEPLSGADGNGANADGDGNGEQATAVDENSTVSTEETDNSVGDGTEPEELATATDGGGNSGGDAL